MATHGVVNFDGWQILTNRINRILPEIIQKTNIFINALDEPIKSQIFDQTRRKIFSYWDTYHSNGLNPEIINEPDTIKVLPKHIINPLSDKMLLGREMLKYNLSHVFPATYESINTALQSVDPKQTPLLFIKHRGGSAGLQVRCIKTLELNEFQLENNHIIQEGINNIALFENRKFEFRFYILIFNKNIYLSKHAFSYVHSGEIYDPKATDYLMQVKKTDGSYHKNQTNNNVIKVAPLFEHENHANLENQIIDLAQVIKPVLESARLVSDDSTYILLGCDSIPCSDGSMKLIEINTFPNLIHVDPMINKLVNIPVLSGTVLLTTTKLSNYSWIKID